MSKIKRSLTNELTLEYVESLPTAEIWKGYHESNARLSDSTDMLIAIYEELLERGEDVSQYQNLIAGIKHFSKAMRNRA